MKTYETKAVVTLPAGATLKMSIAQSERRKRLLQDLGGGRYRALSPVQFKAGEVFGAESLPKALLSQVKELGAASTATTKAKGALGKAAEAVRSLV